MNTNTKQATITKHQHAKQQVKASLKVVDNVPYKGVVLMGHRKMSNGKTFKVPVGYREAFKPCLGDLAILASIRA